jgi:hypothetical protein
MNHSGLNWYRLVIIGALVVFTRSCAEREKQNPFDPNGELNLNLNIISRGAEVELIWNQPNLQDYSGFRIYRRREGLDSTFTVIETLLPPASRQYSDTQTDYQQRYSYYLTVVGTGVESRPSNTVSIVPGPGNVWIVDKWGYQLVNTTYDVEHVIANFYTNWPATDLAIAPEQQQGLILYNDYGIMEGFNMSALQPLAQIITIAHPFKALYDPAEAVFWVIDSSGYLYRINISTYQVQLVPSILDKPVQISMSGQAEHIDIVDQGLNKIIQFDHNGNYISELGLVQNRPLVSPERYAESRDLKYFWLIDDSGAWDFIYNRSGPAADFRKIDSLGTAGDLVIAADSSSCWVANLDNFDSSVLQLSSSGTRQIELKGYYNPYDLEINPYDGTLLVADSGNRRVVHYDRYHQVLGLNSNLNFPVRVMVE